MICLKRADPKAWDASTIVKDNDVVIMMLLWSLIIHHKNQGKYV